MKKELYRILDVNFNRVREGLRVCEDVTRLILNDPSLTKGLRTVRYKITALANSLIERGHNLLKARDIQGDVGRTFKEVSSKRLNYKDIFLANAQRVKESIRVLEEFSKIIDDKLPQGFKRLRFQIYDFEKKAVERLSALRSRR